MKQTRIMIITAARQFGLLPSPFGRGEVYARDAAIVRAEALTLTLSQRERGRGTVLSQRERGPSTKIHFIVTCPPFAVR